MSTLFHPFPRFRVLTINGDPGVFYRLHTYVAGTVNTPKATFQDFAGQVPNTNPVIFDAFGEADIRFATDNLYKLELRDNLGNLQWTVDNYGATTASLQTSPDRTAHQATVRLTANASDLVMTAAGMFPAGSIPVGALVFLETSFGNGQGLTSLSIGTSVAPGAYGQGISRLGATITTPINYTNYSPAPVLNDTDLIVEAEGGPFDGTGSLLATGFWEFQQVVQTL